MHIPRTFLPVAVGVLMALTAACGSTVQVPSAADDRAEVGGPGVEGELGGTVATAPTGTTGSTAPEENLGTSRPDGADGASAPGSPSSGESRPVAPRPGPDTSPGQSPAFGLTETTISIGIRYTRNQGETASNLGGEGYAAGDERDYYDAVIEALNQDGGIAGLEIVPVYYEVDPASGETSAQTAQAACTAWTQDNEVFAAGPAADDTLLACLDKKQVFGLSSALTGASASTFARFPYHIEIGSPGLDAVGVSLVTGLERDGYYGSGLTRVSRVGLATWDIPAYREAVENSLLPTAERADLSVQVEYITNPQSLGDLGATQASVRSAVLKFATSNIDHVLILDGRSGIAGGALLTLLFMQNAASQAYEPRYGLSSHSGLSGLRDSGVPESQLDEALAVGWVPLLDTDPAGIPDSAANPTRRRCGEIYAERGFTFSSGVDEYTAMSDCDFFMFLKTAIEASGQPIHSTGVLQTIDHSLGNRYSSAVTFATSFSATKHAGARYARNAIWTPACSCFRYTGAPYDF